MNKKLDLSVGVKSTSAVERDTRSVLLEAAAAAFAERGLKGVRIREIVDRSGINERMIYHHFGDKQGLYEAVLGEVWRTVGEQPIGPDDDSVPPRDALRDGFAKLCLGLTAHPHLLPLALHESLGGWQHLPPASIDEIPPNLRRAFARGQRDGVFRKDCRFETVYFAVLGAVVAGQLLTPRFKELRGAFAATAMIDETIDLVLKGAST